MPHGKKLHRGTCHYRFSEPVEINPTPEISPNGKIVTVKKDWHKGLRLRYPFKIEDYEKIELTIPSPDKQTADKEVVKKISFGRDTKWRYTPIILPFDEMAYPGLSCLAK
jgi:hypothetical protein